jgi:hypothetical protein
VVRAILSFVAAVLIVLLVWDEVRRSNPFHLAGRFVQSHASARDLVIAWTEDRRAFDAFGDLDLLLRPPDDLDLDRLGPQLVGFPRVWVVAPDDVSVPESFLLRFAGSWRTADGVVVAAYTPPERWPFFWGLLDELPSARVQRLPLDADPRTRAAGTCPRRGDRHVCPGPAWRSVEVREPTINGTAMTCIFAHPANGERLILSYPDVPGGSVLVGWAAVADSGWVPGRPEPPVDLRVTWGDMLAGTVRTLDRPGRQRVWLDLPRAAPEIRTDLRLEIVAARDSRRHFCFDLWIGEPDLFADEPEPATSPSNSP